MPRFRLGLNLRQLNANYSVESSSAAFFLCDVYN